MAQFEIGDRRELTKRYGKPTTTAMAAGVATYPWSLTQLAELLDSRPCPD